MTTAKKYLKREIKSGIMPETLTGNSIGNALFREKIKRKESYSIFDKLLTNPVKNIGSYSEQETAEIHWMADAAYNKSN